MIRTSKSRWALELLLTPNWISLDCETTGLGPAALPIEVAIVDANGDTVLSSLIATHQRIEKEAHRVHGITSEHLANAPTFAHLYPQLLAAMTGNVVLAFNAQFDRRILTNACAAAETPSLPGCWVCVADRYATWRGFNAPLSTIAEIEGLAIPGHRALNDARTLVHLVRRMAGRR